MRFQFVAIMIISEILKSWEINRTDMHYDEIASFSCNFFITRSLCKYFFTLFYQSEFRTFVFIKFKACFQFSNIKISPIQSLCVLFFPREADSKLFQTSEIELIAKIVNDSHCVKNVCIRSYSGPYFPEFGPELLRIRILFLRSVSAINKIHLIRGLTGFSRCLCFVLLLNVMIYKEEFLNIRNRMQDDKMLNKSLCFLSTCKY